MKEGWILTQELNVLNEKLFQSWYYENVIALLVGEKWFQVVRRPANPPENRCGDECDCYE